MQIHKHTRKPVYSEQEVRRITKQICQGLKYLVNKKVIHCDLKPENILFTDRSSQNIKIIDFGASCEDFKTGFFYVQSRFYRAPEIVVGCEYDHAVDMWSLGCIVYELITGQPLFPANDENELMEFMIMTCGEFPDEMLAYAKKYKQFFSQPGGKYQDLIRSKRIKDQPKMRPGSSTVRHCLTKSDGQLRATNDCIDFITKCLALHPEDRWKPQ